MLINGSIVKDNHSHTFYLIKNSMPRDETLCINDHNEMKKLKIVSYICLLVYFVERFNFL